jgi:hypothetical protein
MKIFSYIYKILKQIRNLPFLIIFGLFFILYGFVYILKVLKNIFYVKDVKW